MKIPNALFLAITLSFISHTVSAASGRYPVTGTREVFTIAMDTTGDVEAPGLVPGCSIPAGFSVASATQNTIVVQWAAGNPSTAGFELAKVKKHDSPAEALSHPLFVSSGTTYAFPGLTPGTDYYFYIRRVCQTPTEGSFDYSDWIRISGRTTAAIPSDCGTDTTLISISDVTHKSFNLELAPPRYLSPTGRRLLVRYSLSDVPADHIAPANLGQWQERLIYNVNDLKIDNLYPGGTYQVYCKQLRNGSYMEYTKACAEVGPFAVTLASHNNDCSYVTSVTVSCVSAEFVTLNFNGPALGYDSLRYLIAIKPLQGDEDSWQFYYHFNGPEMTIGDLQELTAYQVSAYLLIGKSGFNYDYICSETVVGSFTTLPRNGITDADGDGIPDSCDPDNTDGPTGDVDNDGIQNQNDDESLNDPFPDMPNLACGVPSPTPPFDPSDLLDNAVAGEIFFINGFPILLTQVAGGNGKFSGAGIIGLPFQTKYLNVEFSNVRVSDTRVIFEGSVYGISDNLNGLSGLPLDTVTYGEERFCKPVPEEEGYGENGIWSSSNSEYNPLGFNQNGQYQMPPYQGWEPGDPYDPNLDPNGFNANGIHFETGTPFNPDSCSQTGFNPQGQVCNPGASGPYYWLSPGTTTEGIALANEVEDTLRPLVLAQLAHLTDITLDTIALIKVRCDLKRDSMRSYFDNLEYSNSRDRLFIFGPNDDWFREGMSQKFKEEPKKLGIELDRNPNEPLLEEMHVNLYHCDVELMRYEAILALIGQLQQEPRLTETIEHLRYLITRFTPEQADYYANIDNLNNWIFIKLDSIINTEYNELHPTGTLYNEDDQLWATTVSSNRGNSSKTPPHMGMLASTGDADLDFILMQQASEITWEDVIFEYRQGWQKVAGTDRGFFLEAICKARELATAPPGDATSYMPITISKDVMGRTYTLYLDNLVFTPGGGAADIYIIINTNPSPDRLVFKAINVPFGPSGFTGSTRLFLGSNVSITLSNAVKMNLFGNDNTNVAFDCNGFTGMSVDGEIEFCREYIVPLQVGSLTPKPDPERVKAQFMVGMPCWGEFVVNLTINPFAITKHDSIKWQVNQVVFDFSSSVTPASIKFPPNYTSPFTQKVNGVIIASGFWRGFYMNTLTVTLPKQFGNNAGATITVGAHDVIFDDTGLSGEVFASPILSLCDGNLGGWAFSIDTFAIQFTKNRLTASNINGLLNLPIFSKGNGSCAIPDDCVRYEAAIIPGNFYSFSVKPLVGYRADVWKANVLIEPSSEIEIKVQNDEFFAKAVLNGSISVDGDLGSNFVAQIPNIYFENLVLRNKAPYFDPGVWDVPNASLGVGFGGFGLLIDTIRMDRVPNEDDRADLKFRAGIIIVDASVGVFMASGGFSLKGKLINLNNRQRWVYDGLIVDDVCLDASFPGVNYVTGCLTFFGQDSPHPTFGRGFRGGVLVDFQGIDAQLAAVGVFGNTGAYKYFMIDALAKFNPGAGIGAMQLVGFGGGAAYHMNVVGDLNTGLPNDIPNTDPETVALGSSLSNMIYSPNLANSLTIHATVVLALAKEEAFNVNATFGISFYATGGIDKVFFKGTARFMDKLDFSAAPLFADSTKPDIDAQICAYVYISYGFAEKQLHGTFKVYIDAADVLQGNGMAELMIKPGYWFINIGTPQVPVKLTLSIPGLNLEIAQVGFYFDIGKNIPAFPGLPSNVMALTGLGNIVANESLRRSGNGFATGVRFDASTGDLEFLIFYARFDLGMGFDLMVQDYGNATCANNNGEPLGINGWYASGQMWAHVHGDVGIKVRLWGQDRHLSILRLSVAAALQAKFPNPFYGRGAVGGNYRILGGLIKGNCRFEFKLGQECQIEGGVDPNQDQKIIVDLSPVDSIEGAYPMTIPRVTFGVPLNEDLNDGTHVWRAQILYANILKNGIALSDEETLLDGKTVLEVKPTNVLPSDTWLTFKVKVQVLKNGLHFKYEEEEVSFKTGDMPDVIPLDNIEAAYPINGQYNFYKGEHPYGKGHIVLKFGMPDLLQNAPVGYTRLMRLTKMGSSSAPTEFAFTYNDAQKKVEFAMPGNIQANSVYRLEMVNKSVNGSGTASLQESYTGEDDGNDDAPNVPLVLYRAYFRVSQYNKFAEKVDAIKQNLQFVSEEGWMKGLSTLSEPLDFFEVYGGENEPLVNTSLNLNGNAWFAAQKPKLKLAYNYNFGYTFDEQSCYISLFTNTTNYFDQQNFSATPVGFEEPVGSPALRLSQTGGTPDISGTINQYLDFTTLNGFSEMWNYLRDNLITYKSWKCSGTSLWTAYPPDCNTPCCESGQYDSCCTDQCVFGGNDTHLGFIHYNPMPLPASGSKFPILIQYRIPGHGLTTSKTIEVIKP